ncbi:hypothetical protein CDCA_CDCA17G4327 [Cyanidium caldarium]|uniref:J domain-containing protein n=1 Tax=Cyanidium caldarium TaxID=2771 RepID=A0AAV9J134_CYACA|nr:hypothetical protein CDCA_CDCA17G4327 [Cyanidium caldarium]
MPGPRRFAPCALRQRVALMAGPRTDWYAVLGVAECAGWEEIRAAYLRRARKSHPDAPGGVDAAAESFTEVQAAYAALSDPAARTVYDALRAESAEREEAPEEALVGVCRCGGRLRWSRLCEIAIDEGDGRRRLRVECDTCSLSQWAAGPLRQRKQGAVTAATRTED